MPTRPAFAVGALCRAATAIGVAPPVTELLPFDVIITGTPRRSSREWAQSPQDARRLAAERFRVDVDRVRLRETYSLTAGDR